MRKRIILLKVYLYPSLALHPFVTDAEQMVLPLGPRRRVLVNVHGVPCPQSQPNMASKTGFLHDERDRGFEERLATVVATEVALNSTA